VEEFGPPKQTDRQTEMDQWRIQGVSSVAHTPHAGRTTTAGRRNIRTAECARARRRATVRWRHQERAIQDGGGSGGAVKQRIGTPWHGARQQTTISVVGVRRLARRRWRHDRVS